MDLRGQGQDPRTYEHLSTACRVVLGFAKVVQDFFLENIETRVVLDG